MQRPRHPRGLVLVAFLLAACGTPAPSASPSAAPSSPPGAVSPEPTPTEGASGTPPASPTQDPIAEEPPPVAIELVADGLAAPIGIAPAPGGWLLVNERAGRVVAIHPGTGERATALDIGDRVRGDGEQGLLGLVLHPDWPEDGRAFVHYSDRDGNTVLSEFGGTQDGDGAPVLDPASEQVLLPVEQPFPNHNGGQLAFGPDGYLWFGLGDGGSGGDPLGNGQNPATLLGDILRLDVAEPDGYAIPDDNPFAGGLGGAPEVYLFGLRNPWRFSFDPVTGLLWVADVGQGAYEEINRLDPAAAAGANLGWNLMEGAHCYGNPGCSNEGLIVPLTEYSHDQGCSVTGGHVYRGETIDGLQGWYLFGDYCSGLLFGIPSDAEAPADGTALAPRVLLEGGHAISSFGTDSDGELYLTDVEAGTLLRIVGG
ncbi:MAG TPA: PQQ-dependent sugar dehydrogenase [Candidatus Limnocylindrales bacterium]|nr:PQQ-dependent sugar dehydrogenase [Candidatus Limnocylindrales bacterium]